MIIGIVGKKQSGKDTIAKLIQYHTTEIKHSYHFTDFMKHYEDSYIEAVNMGSNWEIRRFADKLKDIVCLITGCTRKQLEDESFKNSAISRKWIRQSYIQDGKRIPPYAVKSYTPTSVEHIPITYRQALQEIGTDLFRKQFHPDTWVNATMADYKESDYSTGQTCVLGLTDVDKDIRYPNWLIPDVRFPNEVAAIKERDGIIIKVVRPLQFAINKAKAMKNAEYDKHESETALDNYSEYDYYIDNDGDINDLEVKVEKIISKILKNGNS